MRLLKSSRAVRMARNSVMYIEVKEIALCVIAEVRGKTYPPQSDDVINFGNR